MQALQQNAARAACSAGGVAHEAAATGRAAVRADRARTELRHGRPIVLVEAAAPDAGPVLLAAAIETLDPVRWAALQAWGPDWRLLLTRERLRAIGWSHGASADSVSLAGPLTVEALQSFAALSAARDETDGPTGTEVDGSRLGQARPASAAMQAVLTLARRARLAPAFAVTELPAACLAALDEAEILRLSLADVAQGEPRGTPALRRLSEASVALAARDDCRLVMFGDPHGDAEHVAVVVGRPDPDRPVPVRLHSSCLTGDLLGSLRCDCGDQLRRAVEQLAASGGVLLYLAQEGRGIGLANKLRAYRLQDQGLDTFEADRHLGFGADQRDFAPAVAMLEALGIRRIQLLTNNPRKIDFLRRAGIDVVDRLALVAPLNPHNARYVQAKRERAGHLG